MPFPKAVCAERKEGGGSQSGALFAESCFTIVGHVVICSPLTNGAADETKIAPKNRAEKGFEVGVGVERERKEAWL